MTAVTFNFFLSRLDLYLVSFSSQNAQLDIMISDENGKYVVNCDEMWQIVFMD